MAFFCSNDVEGPVERAGQGITGLDPFCMAPAGFRDAAEIRHRLQRGERHDIHLIRVPLGIHIAGCPANRIPNAVIHDDDQDRQVMRFGNLMAGNGV